MPEKAPFTRVNGIGTVLCGRQDVVTRYVLHVDIGGRPVMVELLDRPAGLACDDNVQVILDDGRVLACQVLDDTSMCTVIGEGFVPAG